MRKSFTIQYQLGITPIEDIRILNSRDKIPAVLIALQEIMCNPILNPKVFKVFSAKINCNKKQTGRPGMDFWHILVLGSLRLATKATYDRLQHYANHDSMVRQILGVENTLDGHKQMFSYNTIRDNISLVDDEMLTEINDLVFQYKNEITNFDKPTKKEKNQVKVDSYVMESNVHFPTDINLLYDACRKCIDILTILSKKYSLEGWRKSADWKQRIKNQMRSLSRIAFRGGKNKEVRLLNEATKYIEIVEKLEDKINETILELYGMNIESEELEYFHKMQQMHIELIERRIINNEVIPHDDKLFSLFEIYTEWINKGKQGGKIELGVKLLIATDQNGFIVDYKLMNKQVDLDQTIQVADRVLAKLGYNNIYSISYDKGFSKTGYKELVKLYISNVILDKRGKLNQQEKEQQQEKQYKKLRNAHSAIESDINCLEHHGLDKCPDKGEEAFKRYVGFGILAYNLHKIGKILMKRNKKRLQEKLA